MGIGTREGVLFGANLGRAIVMNGDFTAYVCDSAAKRALFPNYFGRRLVDISKSDPLSRLYTANTGAY